MANPSKRKGTQAESAVVEYMNENGWSVERRALGGSKDKGDIAGAPVVIEVKNCATASLAQWIAEADAEAQNAGVDLGVVWHKRRGKGSPADWYVTMTGESFLAMLDTYGKR